METKDFRHRDYSDFYESAKHIVADIWEKATLEKIGFILAKVTSPIMKEFMSKSLRRYFYEK